MDKKEKLFIHYAKRKITKLINPKKLNIGPKPNALWFGCNEDWSDFVKEEMDDSIKYTHKYTAILDFSNIIVLKTKKDILAFSNKFVDKEMGKKLAEETAKKYGKYEDKKLLETLIKMDKTLIIDWEKVKQETKAYGIYIENPYISSLRFSLGWYYTIDVCSVAIWDIKAISFMKEEKL